MAAAGTSQSPGGLRNPPDQYYRLLRQRRSCRHSGLPAMPARRRSRTTARTLENPGLARCRGPVPAT